MKFVFGFLCLLSLTTGFLITLSKEDTQLLVDTVVQKYGSHPDAKQCNTQCDVIFSDQARRTGCSVMCFSINSLIARYQG